MRTESVRKPLQHISNVETVSESANALKKTARGGESLNRLDFVQSEVSSMIRKIDELVIKATIQLKEKLPTDEIQEFEDLFADMQVSLKPWIPRLQKVLQAQPTGSESESLHQTSETDAISATNNDAHTDVEPEKNKRKSSVSPSPLVSWRAECSVEGGRQLFLLTPLPKVKGFSSKSKVPEPPLHGAVEAVENNLRISCYSPYKMTPLLKMSPPKSCILLEPASEFSGTKRKPAYRSTPFPVRPLQDIAESLDSSDSSGSLVRNDLNARYPELFGIKIGRSRKEDPDESPPNWILSPPKTCVVMNPPDEKFRPHNGKGSSGVASTPMMVMSCCCRKGKHPGENTLKKELWREFEAASPHPVRYKLPATIHCRPEELFF
ncbi:hypothetical protein M569_05964 [Genlisea aurea]|uniref:Uncharacterized protein n=1 Tax=Genlisea aurea TaxID=192259 RepID=S8CNN5_9LAMI|nr:hypothetical protein M569_05964 [Genlisea aurea]